MPDMFSRFGDEMPIPGRLKIITRGEGNNEEVIQVVHEKRRGRPKGTTEEAKLDYMSILEERTHPHFEIVTFPIYPGKVSHIPNTSKVFLGTSSRPEVFLLGPLSTDLSVSKLPKTGSGEWAG